MTHRNIFMYPVPEKVRWRVTYQQTCPDEPLRQVKVRADTMLEAAEVAADGKPYGTRIVAIELLEK